MKQRSVIAFAIAAAVAAPLAFAQDQAATRQAEVDASVAQEAPQVPPVAEDVPQVPETAPPATFASLDVDQDGRLSNGEAAADAALSTGFEAADTDGDGFVSEAEFDAHAAPDMPAQDVPDVQPETL